MGGVAGVATLSRACWDSLEVCGGFPCRHPPSCVSSPAGVFVRTRTFRKRMREREREIREIMLPYLRSEYL